MIFRHVGLRSAYDLFRGHAFPLHLERALQLFLLAMTSIVVPERSQTARSKKHSCWVLARPPNDVLSGILLTARSHVFLS